MVGIQPVKRMTSSRFNIIDPHLHLINLDEGDYHWLKANNPPNWPNKEMLYRNHFEPELQLSNGLNLSGFIHIEAGYDNLAPSREIAWLEQHCQRPFRSIAFADLTSESFAQSIVELSTFSSFVGIRHILDEQAATLLSNPVCLANLGYLAEQNLIFEAQLSLHDSAGVKALSDILQKQPRLTVVINHAGFANLDDINTGKGTGTDIWLSNVKNLAKHKNCCIKASGWEMAEQHWQVHQTRHIIETLICEFGLQNVMLASNFPVSNLTKNYQNLWQDYIEKSGLTDKQLAALCFDNAFRIYAF